MARQSLQSFLNSARAALKSDIAARRPVNFVIGNESADLDSFSCAILYAYLKSTLPTARGTPTLTIPIFNVPAADIQIRPEHKLLFKHANITDRDIITLDDLTDSKSMLEMLPPDNTRWILVDHNALAGHLGEIYGKRVCGVIDHHEEENAVPTDTGDEPRIVQPCGSCASLVTQHFKKAWSMSLTPSTVSSGAGNSQSDAIDDLTTESESDIRKWNAQAAMLALGPVVVDTNNLTSKKKVTENDVQAAEYLEALINVGSPALASFDRDAFFDELITAKRDIEGLDLDDILRKDYKEWTENGKTLGMSTVIKPMSFVMSKASESGENADLLSATDRFAADRQLSMYAIGTNASNAKGKTHREIFVRAIDPECAKMVEKFMNDSQDELKLEPQFVTTSQIHNQVDDNKPWKLWDQKNSHASRKRVGPLLREAMR